MAERMEERIWLAQLPLYELIADNYSVSSERDGAEVLQGVLLKQGVRFHMLDVAYCKDGSQRLHAILEGETKAVGWLTVSAHQPVRPVSTKLPCFECIKLLKVRERADLTSPEITTLPEGTIIHILETKRLMDGSQRICLALLGENSTFGWATSWKPVT